jgi:hypothetical protein
MNSTSEHCTFLVKTIQLKKSPLKGIIKGERDPALVKHDLSGSILYALHPIQQWCLPQRIEEHEPTQEQQWFLP